MIFRYPFLLSWRLLSMLVLWRFDRRVRKGPAANKAALLKMLNASKDTRIGRRFGFRDMLAAGDPVQAFRERVPLRGYADHAEDIQAIANGASDVLFPGVPSMFVATSGTSNDPKLLPTTAAQQLRTVQHIALLSPAIRWRAAPELRLGQRSINLMLASRASNKLPGGFALGMSSGGGIRKVLRAAPYVWTSPADVFELEDHKTALYLHALFGLLDETAGCIEAVFGTHIVSWAGLLMDNQAELVADIAAGTLRADLDLPAALRQRLERMLEPRPERAQAIKTAFALGSAGILARLWPDLRVLSTVVSGPFAVSLPRLRWLAGDQVRISGTCFGATEGMVGVNFWPSHHERYVISAGTAYYEFLPVSELDAPAPETVTLENVKREQAYELVMTTFAGLYRYRLGDVVRVVDKIGDTPVFEFDHRVGDVLDLVGEKTSASHTQEALLQAANAVFGSRRAVTGYTVTADTEAMPYNYRLYIELAQDVTLNDGDTDRLAIEFDRQLQALNLSYQTIGRKTGRLATPAIVLVQRGSFALLEEQQYREGAGASPNQVKVARVLRDPDNIALLESRARHQTRH